MVFDDLVDDRFEWVLSFVLFASYHVAVGHDVRTHFQRTDTNNHTRHTH